MEFGVAAILDRISEAFDSPQPEIATAGIGSPEIIRPSTGYMGHVFQTLDMEKFEETATPHGEADHKAAQYGRTDAGGFNERSNGTDLIGSKERSGTTGCPLTHEKGKTPGRPNEISIWYACPYLVQPAWVITLKPSHRIKMSTIREGGFRSK
ncbi:hypothetical protein FF38_01591 [Lucilia cuprina]|uniref:Uncharacterized protein n=1 Tax=Lucilia cuprina TaxID=7375 RepID=A0A0L0CF40_LUCCU|nr:hypothetical protein FF38_01591 [Lucilia cuprina]